MRPPTAPEAPPASGWLMIPHLKAIALCREGINLRVHKRNQPAPACLPLKAADAAEVT